MNKQRLLDFANFLDNLKEELFNFGTIMRHTDAADAENICDLMKKTKEEGMQHNCGSVGCAIGWLPAFDEKVVWQNKHVCFEDGCDFGAAAKYFELSEDVSDRIFTLSYLYCNLHWNTVKPHHVAQVIREFIRSIEGRY